mgnify:CR=1 FL=1
MTRDKEGQKPEPKVIHIKTAKLTVTGFPANLFVYYSLAPRWFSDIVRETRVDTDDVVDSIRREIVFSVCFAES